MPKIKFIFFGTDEFAVTVLSCLLEQGFTPALVVTTPDKPAGKRMELTPPPVKVFALKNQLEFIQPESFAEARVALASADLALVASYGKILSREVIDWPKRGTLNIHPSLLPRFRGPSPIQATILAGATPGVTIMQMDEEVDHGPIVIQKAKGKGQNLDKPFPDLRDDLARLGAELFLEVLPDYLTGKVKPSEQDHAKATFTKKIRKEDGEIKLTDPAELNYRKFLAYEPWPGTYFFADRHGQSTRIKIVAAHLADGQFVLEKVIPEGRKEMTWADFLRG